MPASEVSEATAELSSVPQVSAESYCQPTIPQNPPAPQISKWLPSAMGQRPLSSQNLHLREETGSKGCF